MLARFREDHSVRTIFLSAVGDTSIDIPEANVIIQVRDQGYKGVAIPSGRSLSPVRKKSGRFFILKTFKLKRMKT